MRRVLPWVLGCLVVFGCGGGASSSGDVPDGGAASADAGSGDGDGGGGDDDGGTTCSAGACTIEIVAGGVEGVEKVVGMTLDATTIFYTFLTNTADGRVMSVPVTGGSPQVVASGTVAGRQIVVDATSVYWIGSDNVMRKVARAGGAPTELTNILATRPICVDGGFVYWVEPGGSSPGILKRVPTAGGPVESFVTETSAASHEGVGGVFAFEGAIYFSNSNQIKRVGAAGGTPMILAQKPAQSIRVDASGVYFSVGSQVQSVPLTGGVARAVTGTGKGQPFASDEANVYFVDPTAGIQRVGKAQGREVTVVPRALVLPGDPSPSLIGLAVDQTSLYWAAGASIRRTVK